MQELLFASQFWPNKKYSRPCGQINNLDPDLSHREEAQSRVNFSRVKCETTEIHNGTQMHNEYISTHE